MDRLALVRPSLELEKAIWEYRQEYLEHGETRINGSCGLGFFNTFSEWLEVATSIVRDKLSRDGVHASTFFSVRESDGKIVGSIQLRHSLTCDLEKHGGHIGYGIRPTERRKGYGKRQLQLVLEIARQMELPRVMVTCDKSNIASRNTTLSCGGVLAEENTFQGVPQQVFWIELTNLSANK